MVSKWNEASDSELRYWWSVFKDSLMPDKQDWALDIYNEMVFRGLV